MTDGKDIQPIIPQPSHPCLRRGPLMIPADCLKRSLTGGLSRR
jgi:hypothetical protein